MSVPATEQLADAVLYEGYNLYPYRPSALKNQYRWLFGCVLPKCWCEAHPGGERWSVQTQCLMSGGLRSGVEVTVRFLQPMPHIAGRPGDPEQHRIAGKFRLHEILDCGEVLPMELSGFNACVRVSCENRDAIEPGCVSPRPQPFVPGLAESGSEAANVFRLTVRVENLNVITNAASATRDEALLSSLVSLQAILHTSDGEFLSSIDPPPPFRDAAGACENIGLWPVLIGDRHCPTTMLAVPIILEDFPRIAPESPGDLFDGTEIDELLSLRIQTLTDNEKREAAAADERTRRMLQRTESLNGEQKQLLHGMRSNDERGEAAAMTFQPGDRVRLRPRRRADAFDMLLDGRTAVITAVERDFEDNTHLAVTIDDDPGKDLGARGMPGHRFFFHPDEVEPLDNVAILIAGIGNVFKGDDGFGVQVANALSQIDLPDDVAVIDYGIRGVDLAFAITSGYATVILVDAMPRGGRPGRVSVIQPQIAEIDAPPSVQGHNLDPLSVLQWARGMAATLPEVYVVGCEPADIPAEEDLVEGLSPPVRAAVDEAVELIRNLIASLNHTTPVA